MTDTATEPRSRPRSTKSSEPTLEERDHARGCPVLTGEWPAGREPREHPLEQYTDRIPPKPDQGIAAIPVVVTRCVECGGSNVEVAG